MEMTGRDLIVYIMANHLEDAPIESLIASAGIMTIEQAAVKLGVGIATIETCLALGSLKSITLGGARFVYAPMGVTYAKNN